MNCKICYEKYDKENHKPITLMPCGHSLCTNCLVELKKQFLVICPACRNAVSCDKPNYDLIDLLDLNTKTDVKVSIRRSINRELKEFKEMFKEFCSHSERITQESLNYTNALKNLINQKSNEWINVIQLNQTELLARVDTMHNGLADKVQTLMNEQMTRQLKSKNLKQMDQNELLEFRVDLSKFKHELYEKIDKLTKLDYNPAIELSDSSFLHRKNKPESALSNKQFTTMEGFVKERSVTPLLKDRPQTPLVKESPEIPHLKEKPEIHPMKEKPETPPTPTVKQNPLTLEVSK